MKKLLVLLCFVLCFSSALSAKLLTHFEFEDSLGDSAGDNDGTFTSSGNSIYGIGRNGKALVFNGTSDYMEFGKGDFDPRYNVTGAIPLLCGCAPPSRHHHQTGTEMLVFLRSKPVIVLNRAVLEHI